MDASMRIARYVKKDHTTSPNGIYVNNYNRPQLCIKLVGSTMLIMNEKEVVESFPLRGKKTKSYFSNDTLVITRVEGRNRFYFWRFQVHQDERPEEIEKFLKRIKVITTFLTDDGDYQYNPDNAMETDTDSTMCDSATVINNASSFTDESSFTMSDAILDGNEKQPVNKWNSPDTDSSVFNSVSLLKSLIGEGTTLRANHTFVPSRLETNNSVIPYPGRSSFNSGFGNMLPRIEERGPSNDTHGRLPQSFQSRSININNVNSPSSVLNKRPFDNSNKIFPYPVGDKVTFKSNTGIIPTSFEKRIKFTYESMSPLIDESGPSDTTNCKNEVLKPMGETRLINTVNGSLVLARGRLPKIDNEEIMSHTTGKRGPSKNQDMVSNIAEKMQSSCTYGHMPQSLLAERRPLETGDGIIPYQVGGLNKPKNDIVECPTDKRLTNYLKPSINVGERKQLETPNTAGKMQFINAYGNMPQSILENRRTLETDNGITPYASAVPYKSKNYINRPTEKKPINVNVLQSIEERQTFISTNETLPYPTEERDLSRRNNYLEPSTINGERKQFETLNESLPPPSKESGPFSTAKVNVPASPFAERPLLLADEIKPNQASDEITHMNVDTDLKTDALSLSNDLTNQSSQSLETFSLTRVDAEACISEPVRLGPLLVRKAMEQIPEAHTVLTDPKYNEHFKIVEEALERGTDCLGQVLSKDYCTRCAKQMIKDNQKRGQIKSRQEPPGFSHNNCSCNSKREIMKAFILSEAFLPFIEDIKSQLNDNNEE